jgi:hypothetical protein
MANFQSITRLRPEVRQFIRNRSWIHRGDVVTYGPNTSCDAFSTDSAGFRHTAFKGKMLSVADCLERDRYGLALGSSNLYGFGLAGNENTIPSVLAAELGFPFANVCLPEANGRNLYGLLNALVARAKRPPVIVLYMSGGDFTGFCYTCIADPVFGSPNLKQVKTAVKERGGRPGPETQIKPLLAFNALWTRSIAQICRARKIPLVLGNDTTFFEKRQPKAIEVESGLGVASRPAQQFQFATHRKFVGQFYERRSAVADSLRLPLAGPGPSNDVGFIDEFHYDRDGARALATDFAAAIGTIL